MLLEFPCKNILRVLLEFLSASPCEVALTLPFPVALECGDWCMEASTKWRNWDTPAGIQQHTARSLDIVKIGKTCYGTLQCYVVSTMVN